LPDATCFSGKKGKAYESCKLLQCLQYGIQSAMLQGEKITVLTLKGEE
jgi:hypothetical protein